MNLKLLNEVTYITSRSSGPGGQHVNKTESRVELHWYAHKSTALSRPEKIRLLIKLQARLTSEGKLILACDSTRSQFKNKAEVTKRFLSLIEESIRMPKKRIGTKPSRASKEKRLKQKHQRSEIKSNRRRINEL